MRTISLCAYNRPHYLARTIATLQNNDLSKYDRLIINIDPRNKKVIELCNSINFIETDIRINISKLGVRKNPYELFTRVFASGSLFNVHIEDDVVLSPDAFNLANWYFDNFKNNEYYLLSFCNYLENTDDSEAQKVVEYNDFIAIGFCLFPEMWYRYMESYWFKDHITPDIWGVGWDWSLRSVIKKFQLKTLTPRIPRANHIGVIGTHCGPRDFRILFGDKKHYEGCVSSFFLEEKCTV